MAMKLLIGAVVLGILLAPATARAQAEEVVYYHTDAIGSVRMITDPTGAVLARYDYLPFGEPWDPQPNADRLQFGGKEFDTETKLQNFGARYYRPESGRFLSVDPKFGTEVALIDPQRWNRYAYVGNRPTRLVDPDGRGWMGALFKVVVKGGDVYSSVSGIVEDTSTIFSMDARVGEVDRLWATGSLLVELSSAGDVATGIKGIGSFAMRHMDDGRSAYDIAKAGGKHAGMLRNYSGRSAKEIQNGIVSFEEQIATHLATIKDPTRKIEGWDKMDPRKQKHLLEQKWPDDIKRLQEQRDILKGLLAEMFF